MSRARQRGVALLVAIIIFAVATTVAAAVTYNKTMAARRAAATFTMEQALQAGMAAEALASVALQDAVSSSSTNLAQDWAQALDPLEIPDSGIWIQSKVEDMQGRFNLNSVIEEDANHVFVVNQHQYEIFVNLLRDLDIDIRYADLLVDWIDPDNQPSNNGGEDTFYLSQNPPYRPPNTFITHTSELLALPGFGAANYRKIAPFVTALPQSARFNQCTASKLMLDEALNDPTANQSQYRTMTDEDLADRRAKGCWPDKATYTSVLTGQKKADVEKAVNETSDWFRLRTNIRVGTTEFVLYSLLYREGNGSIRPLQRSFGSE